MEIFSTFLLAVTHLSQKKRAALFSSGLYRGLLRVWVHWKDEERGQVKSYVAPLQLLYFVIVVFGLTLLSRNLQQQWFRLGQKRVLISSMGMFQILHYNSQLYQHAIKCFVCHTSKPTPYFTHHEFRTSEHKLCHPDSNKKMSKQNMSTDYSLTHQIWAHHLKSSAMFIQWKLIKLTSLLINYKQNILALPPHTSPPWLKQITRCFQSARAHMHLQRHTDDSRV